MHTISYNAFRNLPIPYQAYHTVPIMLRTLHIHNTHEMYYMRYVRNILCLQEVGVPFDEHTSTLHILPGVQLLQEICI